MACAGIDFGNRNSVVAIARRGGIDICANEVSNRATPTLVSFQADERHIGESAASIAAQNHKNTVTSLQRLLAVPFDSDFARLETNRLTCQLLSHPTSAACAAAVTYTGVEIDDADKHEHSVILPFEALCAMLFSKLIDTAINENGKAPVRDVVISVPVYYTHHQRKAVLNACKIANVNVLRVMNEHAAIALSYGIFRTKELPESNPIKVAFVDIGEASTTVSVAAFTNSKCDIISVASDANLGGRDLDDLIVEKFAAHFKTTYGIDVLSKPKPTARLRKEAEKIKKILSANPESPLNMECLMDDIDVKGHITRDELETLGAPLFEKIEKVCESALNDAKLAEGESLFAVELVGGSTRVPAFKNVINKIFSRINTPIRTTLNADECIARGCSLMSAMLSPTFKVRDYAVTDTATHSLRVEKVFSDGSPIERLTLVPKHNAIPCVKVMKFKSPGALTVNIKYEDPSSLPAAASGDAASAACCGYLIDAPIDHDAKVNARIRVSPSGIVEMSGAQLIKEVEEEEDVVVEQPKTDADANGKSNDDAAEKKDAPTADAPKTDGEPAAAPNGDGAKAADKMESEDAKKTEEKAEAPVVTEKRMVKKKKITDLAVTPLEVGGCGMSVEMVMTATEREAKMKAHDLYIRERSEAMNSLEAYVYDLRSRIDEYGGDLKEYAPSEFRAKLKTDLDAAEEWIYSEEAEEASKSMFVQKKKELADKAYAMLMRKKEHDERPVRIKILESSIESYKAVAVGDAEEYAHIKQEEKDKMLKSVEDAAVWLKAEKAKQEGLAKDVDPALTCDSLSAKVKEVEAVCEPIKNTPKPAPPKEEEKAKEDEAKAEGGEGDAKMDTETAAAQEGKQEEKSSGKDQGKGDAQTNGQAQAPPPPPPQADAQMKE